MDPIRGTSKTRKQIQKHHGKNGTSRRVSSGIIWNYSNTSRFKAISGFNGCSFERWFSQLQCHFGINSANQSSLALGSISMLNWKHEENTQNYIIIYIYNIYITEKSNIIMIL